MADESVTEAVTESTNFANLAFITGLRPEAGENFNLAYYADAELSCRLQRADSLLHMLVEACGWYGEDGECLATSNVIESMKDTAEETQRLIAEAFDWWEAVSAALSPAAKAEAVQFLKEDATRQGRLSEMEKVLADSKLNT